MIFDIPHMIATAVIIFAVIWVLNHAGPFEGMTKGKRTLTQFAILFVLLFILNLVWPYESGV